MSIADGVVHVWLGLVNPGLLALGAGLVAVPILIHLLSRRRVQHVPWAAMQWLLAAVKRHQRRLRLENWLILLLRVAAVFLLGLALARPVLTSPDAAGLVAGQTNLYLVVDTSYSMTARTPGRPVIDVAKAEAEAVLSSSSAKDTVAVVATNDPRVEQSDGRDPIALVARTVGPDGVTKAKESVAGLHARAAPADWAEALVRVREQTAEEDDNRLVVLVTDLQARDWTEEKQVRQALADLLRLPATVRIVDVGGKDRRNLTVAHVESAMKRDVFVGRPTQLSVTVENHGTAPVTGARVSVFRDLDPTPLATSVVPELPGVDLETRNAGSENFRIDLPGGALTAPGAHVLTVAVEPPSEDAGADALGLDSRRGLAVEVRDRIRVVAWARKSRDARLSAETYLRGVYERWDVDDRGERVGERNPLYELRTVGTEGQLADALGKGSVEAPDLVVLANVAPRGLAVDALRDFVRAGGALIVFVGDTIVDPAQLNEPFHANPAERLLPYPFEARQVVDPASGREPFGIDLANETGHPLAGPFTGADAEMWIGLAPPRIWGRMAFAAEPKTPAPGSEGPLDGDLTQGRPVLYFQAEGGEEAKAAVVEGGLGLGRTLWVATSLDKGWFDRAVPFFLPVLLDEAAVYLTRPDEARRNVEVGRRLVVTWLPPEATNVRFIAPGGTETTPRRYEGRGEMDRPSFVQDRVGTPGTWRLIYQREGARGEMERAEERFAVNPDPGEGRLLRATDDVVLGVLPPGTEGDIRILTSWGDADDGESETRRGEIAFLLLWTAIGLLLLESFLAWLFGRRGRPEAPTGLAG